MEMAVPAWSAGLTKSESNQIERVQRAALAIILGEEYYSYSKALKLLKIETLVERREIFLQKRLKGMKSSNIGLWRMMIRKVKIS